MSYEFSPVEPDLGYESAWDVQTRLASRYYELQAKGATPEALSQEARNINFYLGVVAASGEISAKAAALLSVGDNPYLEQAEVGAAA